jgi:hypothetical protein
MMSDSVLAPIRHIAGDYALPSSNYAPMYASEIVPKTIIAGQMGATPNASIAGLSNLGSGQYTTMSR